MNGLPNRLIELVYEMGALKQGDFTLSGGARTPRYFDGRLLTLTPEGMEMIGQRMLTMALTAGAEAVGGPTLGAGPIVTAIALMGWQQGTPLEAFIIRSEAKEHGARQRIEGPLRPNSQVALVDDVCSSGNSLIQAIGAVEEIGCAVMGIMTIVDRPDAGGSRRLRQMGYGFSAMLVLHKDGALTPAG